MKVENSDDFYHAKKMPNLSIILAISYFKYGVQKVYQLKDIFSYFAAIYTCYQFFFQLGYFQEQKETCHIWTASKNP